MQCDVTGCIICPRASARATNPDRLLTPLRGNTFLTRKKTLTKYLIGRSYKNDEYNWSLNRSFL